MREQLTKTATQFEMKIGRIEAPHGCAGCKKARNAPVTAG
jgi:hypothetical protein